MSPFLFPTYTYNDMGQVLTETQPSGGATTSYDYDEAGRAVVNEVGPDDAAGAADVLSSARANRIVANSAAGRVREGGVQ